jgi:hypothetical protein
VIAYVAISTLGVLALFAGVYLALWTVLKDLKWLKAVLVPWMNSIGQAVNPDKK